ncbi:MAG: response regulator [Myxococcota bacterium]
MEPIKSFNYLFCGSSGEDLDRIQRLFEKRSIYPTFRHIGDENELNRAMGENGWNLIFYDLDECRIPLEFIIKKRDEYDRFLPLLVYSNVIDSIKSAEVIRSGATNFLKKDDPERLFEVALDELRLAQLKRKNERYNQIRENVEKYELIRRFAGNVSHKINNLIMVVLNNAAFLSADKGLLPHLKDDVEQLIKVAGRGEEFVRMLLCVAGGVVLNSQLIEVNSFLYKLADNLKAVSGMNIHINVVRSPTPCEIKGDERLLIEAFRKVVENCKRLMPDGGVINLGADLLSFEEGDEFLKASGLKKGEYVRFTLADSAKAIDRELARHIFEPYFSGSSKEKSDNIGMAVSYGIIWEHNGIMDFESIEGRGNFYYFYLPTFKRDSKEILLPRVSEYISKPEGTVLIVEDDEEVKDILIRIFMEEGYNIMDAIDGLGALVMLTRNKPTNLIALITDVIMPKMGGLELARTVREKYRDLKVVFISGYPDNDGEILRFENSIFIQKPITKDALMKRVKDFLFGEKS